MTTNHIFMSCFSCVSCPSAAAFLSVSSESLSCWDAAGTVFPDRLLCPRRSAVLQARLRPARCCSRRQGRETPPGLNSERGTEESRRTEPWQPRGAADCSSAQADRHLRLQRDRGLTSSKDRDCTLKLNVVHHGGLCIYCAQWKSEKVKQEPLPAPLCFFSLSLLLRAETWACKVSTRRSLSSTSLQAFCSIGSAKNNCVKQQQVKTPRSLPPSAAHLQLRL